MNARSVFLRRLQGRHVRQSAIDHHGLQRLFDATDEQLIKAFSPQGQTWTMEQVAEWFSKIDAAYVRAFVEEWA